MWSQVDEETKDRLNKEYQKNKQIYEEDKQKYEK